MATFKSTRTRAQKIKELVEQNYEPGRQDRCKLWVYRNVVRKQFAISERTYFRLLALDNQDATPQEDKRQLRLFE